MITGEDKQAAVAAALQLVETGMSANQATKQVAPQYGVNPRTIHTWAHQTGTPLGAAHVARTKNATEASLADYRARRARLRVDMLRVAEGLLLRIEGEGEAKGTQALAVSLGILVDKIRLEEGEVTSRSETWSADEWSRQLRMLEVQVADAGRAASTG